MVKLMRCALAGALCGAVLGGCQRAQPPRPLGVERFYDRRAIGDASAGQVEAGQVVPQAVRGETDAVGSRSSATAPASAPAAFLGQYWTVGGVVAEVNRTPIYAEKVVNELVHALAAQAKRLDERSFREAALKLLRDQREVMIREELQFAAAEQMLGSEDKNLAKLVTENWRQRKITEAGGSVELARQKAASEGRDFEQMVQDEHRQCMIVIYQQKKVWPRVQVTIEDMRRHYDHNIADFTKKSRAQFRLIKIDPKQAGSREEALRKIKLLYERAAGGWDFAKLAGETNDDPELKRKGGDVGLIQEGAYKLDKIAQAVWKLRIGEITDIIDTGDAFWIAKLESFEAGEVHPFEEEDVQVEIRRRLTAQQFAALREQVVKDLKAAASVREDEELLNAPLEMIMQNYPRWAVQK